MGIRRAWHPNLHRSPELNTTPPGLWDGVLHRLAAELPDFALKAWIVPLDVRVEGDRLRLVCPTAFHRDRVRERYLEPIARCAEAVAGRPVEVHVAASPPLPGASQSARMKEPELARQSEDAGAEPEREASAIAAADVSAPASVIAVPAARHVTVPAARRKGGDARQPALPYRFDNFVVGPCNALAREACLAVAHGRQQRLNPLYLSSPPGLGKTHLARAVVDEARRHVGARVIYASAEAFTNDFMTSIRTRNMDRFKQRYRQSCDLLVVEDVQFLGAKKATQLELFHTLTHLLDVGARIVFTADRLPRDIDGIEARLRSQMAAGLVAELEAPDAAIRRDILRSKSASGGVRLPEDCLQLLVNQVRGSVRDLEGVLIQLVASASLLKRPIDLDLTRAALQKIAPFAARRRLEPLDVINVVAAFFKTRPDLMASRSRRRDVLVPRQLAMYLCRRYTDAPLAVIGRSLGRDHPAVSNAVKGVERRILERAPLRYQVEALCARLEELEAERGAH